jgi:hypothetical protein
MFKQIVSGLYFLLGLCVFSAVLQTLHITDPQRVLTTGASATPSNCSCDDLARALRPTR